MEVKEKHKKKPPRRTESERLVRCENCGVKVSQDSMKKCRCLGAIYCSQSCKKKSVHFKMCSKIKQKQEVVPLPQEAEDRNTKFMMAMIEHHDVLKDKTFDDLLLMEDNPAACMIVVFSLEFELKMKFFMRTLLLRTLPKQYVEMSEYERKEMAFKWCKKAHDLGFSFGTTVLASFYFSPVCSILHLDKREGLEVLSSIPRDEVEASQAEALFSGHPTFETASLFLVGIKTVLQNLETKPANKAVMQSGLGALVVVRCSDHLLDIIQDKPGVGLSKEEWGFKELHQVREKMKNTKKELMSCYWSTVEWIGVESYVHNEASIKYVTAPCYDAEAAMNDLKRIAEGPKEIDSADHAFIDCLHNFIKYVTAPCYDAEAPMNDLKRIAEGTKEIDSADHSIIDCLHSKTGVICRGCYHSGYQRVRAVASGAYCMTKNWTVQFDGRNGTEHFGVIFGKEDGGVELEQFMGYGKTDINLVLRYLSVHSADVDPRMVCINPDLYWSIIWHYGSVTKALMEAGGQKLYDLGFGKQKEMFMTPEMLQKFANVALEDPLMFRDSTITSQYSTVLLKDHFVSQLTNKKMEWRYRCSNPSCFRLEDSKKFLGCGGCSNYIKKRYCSPECQTQDWGEHKKSCQSMKTKEPAWKTSQQRKKANVKKMI